MRARIHVTVLLAVLVTAAPALAQPPAAAGGEALLKARCLVCHQDDIIRSQRLSKAGWGREIDKMVRWGARIDATERETLSEYLWTAVPAPIASHDAGATAAGEVVFKQACLVCHGTDIVEQQRLTRAGWVREVDKMIRWGARVPDADKDALVAFLSARHGTAPRR